MPLTGIEIRQLRTGDAVALAEFYNTLSAPSKRLFKPCGLVVTLERCRRIVRENQPEIGKKFDAVAVLDKRIVGWSFLWSLQSGSPTFGLAVADDFQNRRLGGKLMDHVLQAAAARDIHNITLTVVRDNKPALRLYERKGFERRDAFVGTDGVDYIYMVFPG